MLSIVIPVYNRAHLITETLESCLSISIPFEIIIVDDGSTDNTFDTISKFIDSDDSRSKYISLIRQENKGASAARNAGFHKSKGDVILFLDSDDHLHADVITSMYTKLVEGQEIQICYAGYKVIKKGKIDHTSQAMSEKYAIAGIIRSWITHPSAILYKRSLLSDANLWNEDLPAMQDYDFTLRMFWKAKSIKRFRQYAISVDENRVNRISTSRFSNHHLKINQQFVDSYLFCLKENKENSYEKDFLIRYDMYIKNYLHVGNMDGIKDLGLKINQQISDHHFPIERIMALSKYPRSIAKLFYYIKN